MAEVDVKHAGTVLLNDARIVRILSITDTRQYMEDGDRLVPVPGSGDIATCERCGRAHEVHAVVELASGRTATVGTGCAERDSTEMASKMRRGASAAKQLARLRAERAAEVKRSKRYEQVKAEVEVLPLPRVEIEKLPDGRTLLLMGDAKVWSYEGDTKERRDGLVSSWRRKREAERGVGPGDSRATYLIEDLDEKIAKLQKQLKELAK